MLQFVTDLWKIPHSDHQQLDFVNVAINTDNQLFIDPILLETTDSPWAKEAYDTLMSFVDDLYSSYRSRNEVRIKHLLSHAHERNEIHLGYGRGNNGKGTTPEGLHLLLKPLENLVQTISTIEKPQDLCLFLPGFAEDRMSDMIANIICYHLIEFTLQQMKKYGIKANGSNIFTYWDARAKEWKEHKSECYVHDGHVLLLIPKQIVRHSYFFDTGKYFFKVILEKERETSDWRKPDGKLISKKDMNEIIRTRSNSLHWMYEHMISITRLYPQLLLNYHALARREYRGKALFDDKIDEIVYRKKVGITAQ